MTANNNNDKDSVEQWLLIHILYIQCRVLFMCHIFNYVFYQLIDATSSAMLGFYWITREVIFGSQNTDFEIINIRGNETTIIGRHY